MIDLAARKTAKPQADNTVQEAVQSVQAKPEFTKAQILASAQYRSHRDLVNALLDGDKTYTKEAVDELIDKFLKGRVK